MLVQLDVFPYLGNITDQEDLINRNMSHVKGRARSLPSPRRKRWGMERKVVEEAKDKSGATRELPSFGIGKKKLENAIRLYMGAG